MRTRGAGDGRGWSTRELAEMVGATVKAVRYYHQVGLLEEPRRRSNGYKTYGPEHVVQLLGILRMREVGYSVAEIAESARSEDRSSVGADDLLARIDRSIQQLQAVRDDLVACLDREGRLPSVASGVPDPGVDAAGVMGQLMARHFTREAMTALRAHDGPPSSADDELEQLSAGASEAEIADLAARLRPQIRRARAAHPMPERVVDGDRADERRAAEAIGRMLSEIYNPAQLQVIERALDEPLDERTSPD